MAVDEVLALALQELGFQFHDTLVNGFVYVDDLILIAENITRLKEKLAAASTTLSPFPHTYWLILFTLDDIYELTVTLSVL